MSVGRTVKHDSSLGHVTGKSIFVDDRAFLKNEVHVGYVGSPISHGKLKNIDCTEALKVNGVIDIYTAKDVVDNHWGTIVSEQPMIVADKIAYMDEVCCIVAAETREALYEAKSKVKLEVEEFPAMFTIDEAIAAESFSYKAFPFVKGDVEASLKTSEHVLEGSFYCGGQEHFYLESQASIVYPLENGQLEVHSSSQHPSETQRVVAEATGRSLHQVTCIVKRMGGGFGGKESQAAPFAAYAAIVADKLQRPARIAITKDEDMAVTGKRHPFKIFYKVGFNKEGVLNALEARIYSNAGAYADLSSSILERAMFHIDGAYYIENAKIEGACCRTNMHSNTAFRGFGGPQGLMAMESIMEDIAQYLKLDAYDIRRKNCYGIDDRNITPYGQEVTENTLPELFDTILTKSDYKNRVEQIKKFNSNKIGKVRGISCMATKFGIAFTARFLNQGNALVNLHLDASVQASTGATEMGQGVNTKIQQTCAHAFGISTEKVQIMPTSTEKNHNTSPTAASSGADINCAAALKACDVIKNRLCKVAYSMWMGEGSDDVLEIEINKEYPDLSHYIFKDNLIIDPKSNKELALKDVIGTAYFNRVSMGEYAHFKTEGLGFDKKKGQGKAFNYFTNGVAVNEVEVDEYTGDMKVLRTDLLMDLGRPINPGIDEGQVVGAFIQGMGWVTTENLYYTEEGRLVSHSPTTYKIPNIQDTPRVFNVDLISNDANEQAVHRSKAVGEPPFLLGIGVWTAVKNAISYRSKNSELSKIESPATGERILMELQRLK